MSFSTESGTSGFPDDAVTDVSPTTSNDTAHRNIVISLILTFVGTGIAILGIILTLFSYLGSKKFRVKRPHMVLVNLCLSLLVYFVAYALSNFERHRESTQTDYEKNLALCTTGAFLTHVSVLWSWFWIGSYWVLVLIMYQRPSRGHIHHFFIKAALPCYGIPLVAAITCIVVASSLGHNTANRNSTVSYSSQRCFVQSNYLYGGLMTPFFLVTASILGIFFYIVYGLLFQNNNGREARNKKRVQIHLIKLTIITIIACIVFLSTLIVPATTETSSSTNMISEYIFAASAIALGVLLMILFCLLQAEIRLHWSAVLTGSSRLKHRNSLSASKYEGVATTFDSRKASSASRQPMIQVDPNISSERKSSTIRIVPKQDEDLSNLNLIPIPQESTPKPVEKRNSKQIKSLDTATEKKSDKNEVDKKEIGAADSSVVANSAVKLRSEESIKEKSRLGSRCDKGNMKRRSFSTSNIKPESNKQLSLLRRQSVLSNDSTCMTSFD